MTVYFPLMDQKKQDQAPQAAMHKSVFISEQHQVERAAGEFRRGVPVLIRDQSGQSLFLPAETLAADALTTARGFGGTPLLMVLTHARAQTLKIPLYTPDVVAIRLEADVDTRRIRSIADPATDLSDPLKGPFDAVRSELPSGAAAAVRLAKLAGLLPAVVAAPIEETLSANLEDVVKLDASLVERYQAAASQSLQLVARARLPLKEAETCELVSFRPADGGTEHHAIIIGESSSQHLATPGPVLARLHSECFTGDLLGSLRCDCGDQLRGAVEAIAEAGGGILLYLAQEGRGIGLMNKLRAYELQDQGFDTIDANERLGFEADERLYDSAAQMLKLLGYNSVRLMTNNPEKIRALEAAGIDVKERVPHSFPDNIHNRDYIATKAKRGGHLYR
jgi:GTP cyclohydrolase II